MISKIMRRPEGRTNASLKTPLQDSCSLKAGTPKMWARYSVRDTMRSRLRTDLRACLLLGHELIEVS